MSNLQSLSCTLRALLAGAVVWQITENGPRAQALNITGRRSWDIFAPFSNETGHFSPASNITAFDVGNQSQVYLGKSLRPSLNSYNNVSSLPANACLELEEDMVTDLNCSFQNNVCSGMINVSVTGQMPSNHSSITQGHYTM